MENVINELREYIKNKNIKGISQDSKDIKKDYMYFAVDGTNNKGKDFIPQAIASGATVIILDKVYKEDLYLIEFSNSYNRDVRIFFVKNILQVYATLVTDFYVSLNTLNNIKLSAITGTNGKSSVTYFVSQFASLLGLSSGHVGTTGIYFNDNFYQDSLTTPSSKQLALAISEGSKKEIDLYAIEASSHGLAQLRLDGLKFDAAGFTNLTQDHLDYHHSMEEYYQVKSRLFTELLKKDGVAVINTDDDFGQRLYSTLASSDRKIISYGKNTNANIKILQNSIDKLQLVTIEWQGEIFEFEFHLIGEFQVMNLLCALGIMNSIGFSKEELISVIKFLKPVKGRMEKISTKDENTSIFIDYAHTPDALRNSLIALRPYVKNRLLVLFGCGGDRDKGKRKIMGEVAQELADYIIVSDDNPRSENPSDIRKQILFGCPDAIDIDGRRNAIKFAINNMQKGDCLLIAGKGHEMYHIIGNESLEFDEFKIVSEFLVDKVF